MNGVMDNIGNLSVARKILLAGSLLLVVVLMLFVTQMPNRVDKALLYSGLEGGAAGDVIAKLEQMGVPSEVRGSAIYVDAGSRDRVRMLLAASGLPAGSAQGYELLDDLSGFGTTSEMFDASYWRAKEGELARTLLAAPDVSQARVHIGTPRRRNSADSGIEPTASVTLTGGSGPVSRSTALSARYLVALAIPGLSAGQVAVIDANGGVLLRPGDDMGIGGGFGDSERAQQMKAEIGAMLDARVGPGRARVSVNIETTRESETVRRRTIDPGSKSLRQSRSAEIAETGKDEGGATTVASNLPDGDGADRERSSSLDEIRRTDIFDYTETREEVLRPAGTIKRISVAVLLDEIRSVAEDGTVISEPRPRDEIRKLEGLVKSAIGFDDERGDLVTVESIPFADMLQQGSIADTTPPPSFLEVNMLPLVQVGVLSLVAILLGLFVIRPVLMAGTAVPGMELDESDPAMSAIDITPNGTDDEQDFAGDWMDAGDTMGGGELSTKSALEMLRETVGEKNDESVAVIRGWLEDGTAMEQAR